MLTSYRYQYCYHCGPSKVTKDSKRPASIVRRSDVGRLFQNENRKHFLYLSMERESMHAVLIVTSNRQPFAKYTVPHFFDKNRSVLSEKIWRRTLESMNA
jgi:hypothetical protein